MASSVDHWFRIEEAFRAIKALNAKLRALMKLRSSWPDSPFPAEPSPPATKYPGAAMLTEDLAGWDYTFGEEAPFPERPFSADEVTRPILDKPAEALDPSDFPKQLDALLAQIREYLRRLRTLLRDGLSPHEAQLVLFPIIIYIDEMTGTALQIGGGDLEWRPFQQDFLRINNGGERFYSQLDELFVKEDTIPLIFEVFYFCLKDGFGGLHARNPKKKEEYMRRLEGHVRHMPPSPSPRRPSDEQVRPVDFPWQYYAYATVGVLLLFIVFRVLGCVEGSEG